MGGGGGGKTESLSVKQDTEFGCAPAIGHEGVARELFPLSCDDALNQGNISLLQRVHRLDNILSTMEDKAPTEEPSSSSVTSPQATRCPYSLVESPQVTRCPSSLEKRCKSTESVLEEVEVKGTLVERVSELEKRVMKLQRMINTRSAESVAYPAVVHVASTAHSMPPHEQAMSDHDYDQQSLQDLIDVEKHEVTTLSSAPIEHDQHPAPFIYSEKNGINSEKRESPHMEGHEGMALSDSDSVEERNYQKQSKKKSLRIKKWLSKRLHITFPQDKRICATGHCWSSHTNPQNCWNVKRASLHPSPTYTQYGHHSIVEGSP